MSAAPRPASWTSTPGSRPSASAIASSRSRRGGSVPLRRAGVADGLELGAFLPFRPLARIGQPPAQRIEQQAVRGDAIRAPGLRVELVVGLVIAVLVVG